VVLVDDAIEESSAADGGVGVDHDGRGVRAVLVSALVWPVLVEVLLVFAHHRSGVLLVVDRHPVGAFGPHTAHNRSANVFAAVLTAGF
jgi:hypothetical protein